MGHSQDHDQMDMVPIEADLLDREVVSRRCLVEELAAPALEFGIIEDCVPVLHHEGDVHLQAHVA